MNATTHTQETTTVNNPLATTVNDIKVNLHIAIANYVDKDLRGCFAKQATLSVRARCNSKTLRTHVHALADKKVIITGDPGLVAHLRADARPDVWDLNADLPTDPAAGNFYPPRGVKLPGREGANLPSRPVKTSRATGKNARAEQGSDPGSDLSPDAPASGDAPEPPAPAAERETIAKAIKDDCERVVAAWLAARGGRRNETAEAKVRKSAASLLVVGRPLSDVIAIAEDMAVNYRTGSDLTIHDDYWAATQPATSQLPPWCTRCGDDQPAAAASNPKFRTIAGKRCPACHPDSLKESA